MTATRIKLEIITCPQWCARKSKQPIVTVPASYRIIVHHTAGHHPEISAPSSESRDEAIRYARAIQDYHMDGNGWIDSGHNFLVCRNGLVLQGRWLTVSAIEAGHMVESAHCPGQNGQIGIEHEHLGSEPMPAAQQEASARLIAWISAHYNLDQALPLAPHHVFYNTSCPANIEGYIPSLAAVANQLLTAAKT